MIARISTAHCSRCWSEEAGWWERLPQKCLTRTRTDQNKVQFRKTPHDVRSISLYHAFQILCKRVKLWLSRGKISTLVYRNQHEGCRFKKTDATLVNSIPIGNCAISASMPTDISNANSRIQSCKYENSGCWGKNTFCLRFMDAELRLNAFLRSLSVQNLVSGCSSSNVAKSGGRKLRHSCFFCVCKYLKLWLF